MPDVLQIKTFGSASTDLLTGLLDIAFRRAMARERAISDAALQIPGMSGNCIACGSTIWSGY